MSGRPLRKAPGKGFGMYHDSVFSQQEYWSFRLRDQTKTKICLVLPPFLTSAWSRVSLLNDDFFREDIKNPIKAQGSTSNYV